jgi:ribosomal protein S17E
MWQQYPEEMKRELMKVAAREKNKNQLDNVVQFSNREHQNRIPPFLTKVMNSLQ